MEGSRLHIGLFLALLALAVAVFVLPATAPAAEPPGLRRAMQVQERNTARLMALPGVVGTAVGLDAQGQPVVKVFTTQAGVAGLPANLDGLSVVVDVTGPFIALPGRAPGKKPPPEPGVDPTDRFDDPVPIGVSVGNEFDCSAGTIGCRVSDGTLEYALSNHHVFDPDHNSVIMGERVVQHARLDDPADDCFGVATENNILGLVVASQPIDFSGVNYVDAAIAVVPTELFFGDDPPGCRSLSTSTPEDGYGMPKSGLGVEAVLNQAVQKYGRSTGLTKGQVGGLNATVLVGYVDGTATFEDQILITGRKFLKPGDSGSLVVTDPGREPVGLLFAGNTRGSLGIANPIGLVLSELSALTGTLITIDGE